MLRQNVVKCLNWILLIALVASSQPYRAVGASPQRDRSTMPSGGVHRWTIPQQHVAAINAHQTQPVALPDGSESLSGRMAVQTGDRISIRNNNIYNNGYGFYTAIPVVAESNWWGDASGPYHPTLNPGGQGNQVSDNVDFDPWLSQSLDLPHAPSPEPPKLPQIRYNNFEGNGYGLYKSGSTVLNAENNWWGDASGPYHPTVNPGGRGNQVSDNVDFDPWLTVPAEEALRPPAYDVAHNSVPSSAPWSPVVAEPVSVIFGNYIYQHTDLAIPGLGPEIALQRTYNSANPTNGPLGYGWTHTYVVTVTQETTSTVLVKSEDGRLDRFADDGLGTYSPPPGVFNTLTENPDGTFTLTHKDQTVYSFDTAGRLTSIVDKNGNTVTLTYTGDNLTTITDAAGHTTTLTYDANNHITQVADPAGRTVTYSYDAAGNLVSVTDARGYTTTYTYDDQHRLLSITDANSHTFVRNTYDGEGRVIRQQDALGNVTTFSYDRLARRTTVTDPLGRQTVYAYDANWRVVSETDPLGHTETYTYDAQNNRTSVIDKRGNITRYVYDANGNTTVITDTLGNATTMTYDARNNLTSRTDALGRTTTYIYDANGNLISTTDPLSNTTIFTYDAEGQLVSITDANGNTSRYAYDQYGYRTVITDALGNATTFTYDNVGRKLSETDANGNTTTYTYDAHNNLLTVTDPLGGVTRYTYDNVGNRIAVTDALSRTTTYAYDAKDRLVSVMDPLSNTTTYAYDAVNNRIQVTDANGHTTTFAYDALNRLASVTDPLSNTVTYEYDAVGNRTAVTDPNGHRTTFTYDTLNRLIRVTDPLGNRTTYTYDAVGNKTSLTDANGNATTYTYDALNRLASVTDASGGTVIYTYDPVGNKTSMTDANGHITTYTYDALNRLTTVTDPGGNTTTYTYDAVGNRTGLTDANGQTTTYTYDAFNRLTRINYPTHNVDYTYDAVGNRTLMTDTTGTTTYIYDDLDRLTQITDGAGYTVSYAYDAVSNRTRITYPNGDAVTYAYDAADRLTSVTNWASRTVTYTYDAAGNLLSQTNPNGTSTTYTYDAANRLTKLVNNGPSGVISSFAYTLDAIGNRTRITEANGDVTEYTYDALYRLSGVKERLRVDFNTDCVVDMSDIQASADAWRTANPTFDLDGSSLVEVDDIMRVQVRWGETCEQTAYTYDSMGNRTSLTTSTGTITYTYDTADRLLSISDGTAFTWDANGNQLSKGSTTYTYDIANRLTQITDAATTVQFTYDGDGKRTNKTVNGATTSYTYDVNTPLLVVLVESTAAGEARYIYGLDLIARAAPGSTSYYHYDGLGSTRQLTDEAGEVVAGYEYDAFGNLRGITGSSANPFTFTGEQVDAETRLAYLRARYYDPEIGRFLMRDSFEGFDSVVSTLNKYAYSENRPTVLTDPSGEFVGLALLVAGLGVTAYKGGQFAGYAYESYKERSRLVEQGFTVDPHEVDRVVEAHQEWARSLVQETLPRGVEFATSPPGTSFTGPVQLPSRWWEISADVVLDYLRDREVKNALYGQRVKSQEGGLEDARSGTRRDRRDMGLRTTSSFGELLLGATPSYVFRGSSYRISESALNAQPLRPPWSGK